MTLPLTRRDLFGAGGAIMMSPRVTVLLAGFSVALLLALPSVTVSTRGLDDFLLVADGIQRLLKGQVSNVDFGTLLGPLAYTLPELGYRLTGSFGGAMPAAMAIAVAIMTVVASHVLTSRLRPMLAISFGAFLLFILAAPMYLGDGITALSFTMYYNRIGWVGVGLLLLLFLSPAQTVRHQGLLDAASAVVLTLLLAYTRLSYGAFALAFLLLMLFDRRQRQIFAASLVVVVLAGVVVELFWGGTAAYVARTLSAPVPEGIFSFRLFDASLKASGYVADFSLLAVIAGLVLYRQWSPRSLAFFLLCALGGLWLISLNVQRWGIISIHAGAVVAAELLLREMDERPERGFGSVVNPGGIMLYALAFLLPTILHCALAYVLHVGSAMTRAGEPLTLPRLEQVRIADLWTGRDFGAAKRSQEIYRQGLELLSGSPQPVRQVAVPGSADPFSLALDLIPADPGPAGLRPHAIADPRLYLPPVEVVEKSDAVLLRRKGPAAAEIAATYDALFSRGFVRAGENEQWLLLRKASAGLPPSPGSLPQ